MTETALAGVREAPTRRSTRANALALSGGRFIAALGQWVVLIILAKATDVGSVGMYALAQAVCIPVAEVARLGLRELRASDVRDEFSAGTYLAVRTISAVLALVVMVGAGAAFADSGAAMVVLVLYALTRAIELVSDVLYAMLQREERLDLVAWSLGLLTVASLIGTTVGLLWSGSVVGATIGQVVAFAVVFAGFDLPVTRSHVDEPLHALRPTWDRAQLLGLLRRMAPLAIATVLAMVALHATKLVVAGELGVEALGLFVPVTVVAMAPGRLFQALATSVTTRLSILHASNRRRDFVRLMGQLLALTIGTGLVGVAVTVVAGEWLLRTLYTDEYAGQGTVLVLVMIAAVARFAAEMLQQAVIAAGQYWWLTWSHALGALAAVVAAPVLIPRHDLVGAGGALVAVACVQFLVFVVGAGRNLPAPDGVE